MPSLAAILPAAGRSTRFGSDKLRSLLHGVPVVVHSVLAFVNHPDVASVIVAQGLEGPFDRRPDGSFKPVHAKVQVVAGGPNRAQSVLSALQQVPTDIEWVAIHDAARPLVSADLINRVFTSAQEHGAAAPAMPVTLTIKQATGPLPAKVQRTVPRHELWAMQTPQIIRRAALLDAYARCPIPLDEVTDDIQLIELIGGNIWLVPGDERNLKITTAVDLKIAETFNPA